MEASHSATRMTDIIEAERDNIYYSGKYYDDIFEYRHVHLPKKLFNALPSAFLDQNSSEKKMRLLTQDEVRSIGVTQSDGWVHFGGHRPEPNILLFRRKHNGKTQ